MRIEAVSSEAWDVQDVDAVAVGLSETAPESKALPRQLQDEDQRSGGALSALLKRGELTGKRGELHSLVGGAGTGPRLLVVGLGKASGRALREDLRRAGAVLARHAKAHRLGSIAVRLSTFSLRGVEPSVAAADLAQGAELGAYEFSDFRTSERNPSLERLVVALGRGLRRTLPRVRSSLDRVGQVSEAVLWARQVGNQPANVASPAYLAEKALELGRTMGLKVTVFDEAQLQKMGCGGLLAVGGGSSGHPPRMVVLEYPGRGAGKLPTIAVVGKGITFDSGGISIKPALHMSHMKFDKSGAVAVLGILRAAARLKVRPKVVGVLCCAENVPSGTSYRPGDLVRTFGGKTIEVLNTDAEGRVVLSDGLAWVNATHHPDAIIDLATLTAACVTALGHDVAGLFSTDERLARALLDAAEGTGEGLWRLPLKPLHDELVRSEVADVKNSLEAPPGGALTAAAFLHTFVGETPWAHLDIAGTAYVTPLNSKWVPPYHPPGYVAFGVRLITEYLQGL